MAFNTPGERGSRRKPELSSDHQPHGFTLASHKFGLLACTSPDFVYNEPATLDRSEIPKARSRPMHAHAPRHPGTRRFMLAAFAAGIVAVIAPAWGQVINEDFKILASDGTVYDYFGYSVSVSGETAVVGAYLDDDLGDRSGSAYVFEKVGGVWTQQAKLLASDGAMHDYFGLSVSVSGETAVVGAYLDDDLGDRSGSAYVFERVGGVWTQQAKLLASDGATHDRFGWSVSVSGETAVVGAWRDDDNGFNSGSAYVFEKVGGVWTQQAKLLPSDGEVYDRFGWSVSVSGETAVVGAYDDDNNGTRSGSAYVFEKVGGVWTQQAKLLPSDGAGGDHFGLSVSVSGETAVVGAYLDDDNGLGSGSAYVFEKVGGVWTQQAKLLASDGVQRDYFGFSVSVSGDTAVVGAYGDDDNGTSSGSAYVFEKVGGVWTQQVKMLPSYMLGNDEFGDSVSVSGETAVVGAHLDDDNGNNSGSAYVFDLGGCPADLTGDGVVNTQDFIAFLGAWSAGEPIADWNNDGVINTQDFVAFLGDWAAGCP